MMFIGFILLYQTGCAQEQGKISSGVGVGSKVIDFTLKDLGGDEVNLKDLVGKEAILLVFSTTWCPSCREKIPRLNELYNEYDKKGLKILNVYVQESQRKVASFAQKNGINYTILLDLNGAVTNQYKVRGVPTLITIDKKGIIRDRGYGLPPKASLEALIRR
jgi:peroxiredoxin